MGDDVGADDVGELDGELDGVGVLPTPDSAAAETALDAADSPVAFFAEIL